MPSLLTLPQEIRDKIYIYVLALTGTCHIYKVGSYVHTFTYNAYPSAEPIYLSIIQIDPSAAPIVFTHNIIRVSITFHVLGPTFIKRIQKLQVFFRLCDTQFQSLDSSMNRHAVPLSQGSLKELRYEMKGHESRFRHLADEPHDPHGNYYFRRPGQQNWGSPHETSSHYHVYLSSLLETTRELFMETDVKFRIDLELDVKKWEFRTPWRSKKPKLRSEQFIREMGDAFGGEVWIDGVLCWKDDQMVGTVFGDWKT